MLIYWHEQMCQNSGFANLLEKIVAAQNYQNKNKLGVNTNTFYAMLGYLLCTF